MPYVALCMQRIARHYCFVMEGGGGGGILAERLWLLRVRRWRGGPPGGLHRHGGPPRLPLTPLFSPPPFFQNCDVKPALGAPGFCECADGVAGRLVGCTDMAPSERCGVECAMLDIKRRGLVALEKDEKEVKPRVIQARASPPSPLPPHPRSCGPRLKSP